MSDPSARPDRVAEPTAGRPVMLPDGWTVSVTDRIVTTVDAVAAKTTKPITLIARGLVYGLLLGTAGVVAVVLLLAMVLRLLVIGVGLVPGLDGRAGRPVWVVDVVLGLALVGVGAWIMRKGRLPDADPDAA